VPAVPDQLLPAHPIRVLVADLDGTLLDARGRVSPARPASR
jgi:predicted mannosyl-3-phosphoglycerate phosphatase (HAD superfamily)